MILTDAEGTEWVTATQCLELVPGLGYRTLQSWWRRQMVRHRRVGRQVWVAWPDVLEIEAAAHLAGWKRGRHAAKRPGLDRPGA
ncbi:Uncharacterised protein [Actinomyces bovis]|uniref:Uncharacterized protein n=1 Tax=Actinomyces bovis TaxID=1658 RepID=A0ABY1VNV3_9ACTO|nr:Uncharacterised protein [Actinomyces bovis]VEG53137.1 Uncharacterised protein [Actinomyces israelii]